MRRLNFKKPGKKAVIITVVIVLLIAIGCGVWYYVGHNSSDPVYVYPFQYIGMTEFWGDSQESYGPVTTDKIQTIFLSDTQTVTEICVKEGDQVKKGDLLMTFDTTLSDLALERKRLEVEKLKLQLQDATKQLREINSLKPMKVPTVDEPEEEDSDLGFALDAAFAPPERVEYDGSSLEKSMICWLHSNTAIDENLLDTLRELSERYQNHNAEFGSLSSASDAEEGEGEGEDEDYGDEEEPEEDPYEPFYVDDYYVIFKITQGNMSRGRIVTWQGMHVYEDNGGGFYFKLMDATMIPDHTLMDLGGFDVPDLPDMDFGSGFTAEQIAQMRAEQEKKIKDLDFQIKMADADYRIMQTEVNDGRIYAEIDGKVIGLIDEQEAKDTMQPVMKVSGGGGFYVEGSVSELNKDKLQIGQEVTINDWRNGGTYTGTVKAIGDFPSQNESWSGMDNPTTSYYPFYVFVDETADMQAGSYVSVVYSAGASQNGIYLENPFIRTEQGRSYVMVKGQDGRLEKRFVTTGKSLWGSRTEILSGLSAEDMLAFPYGKNVKPGVSVQEGDLSNLYG